MNADLSVADLLQTRLLRFEKEDRERAIPELKALIATLLLECFHSPEDSRLAVANALPEQQQVLGRR